MKEFKVLVRMLTRLDEKLSVVEPQSIYEMKLLLRRKEIEDRMDNLIKTNKLIESMQ